MSRQSSRVHNNWHAMPQPHLSTNRLHFPVGTGRIRQKLIGEVFGGGQPRQVVGELHKAAIGHQLLDKASEGQPRLEGRRMRRYMYMQSYCYHIE